MASVTSDLLLQGSKSLQSDMAGLKTGQCDIRNEIQASRQHQNATQADTANIYSMLAEFEKRFERIERRFEILDEPAE